MTAVIVHVGLREWYVAVAHPDGHYVTIPGRFENPDDAVDWLERLELLATAAES